MIKLDIAGVFIGRAEDIGGGLLSAIDKQRVDHRLWLWPQGLGNDEQGDTRFHGGPERALHHYPAEHYAYWRERYPQVDWHAPSFGENLSSSGLTEQQVCIGDVFRWGDALLQVSQPRSPCYRLSRRWSLPGFPQEVQDNGRCGWFYRVLEAGFVSTSNPLELIERPFPSLSVAQAMAHFFHTPLQAEGLEQLQTCPALSSRWRDNAARRLASGQLEDWSSRLLGQPLEGVSA